MSDADEDLASPASPDGSVPGDNSVARLLTVSDGVFAIAMTLLALDLKVPDLGANATDAELRHHLAQNSASYWAFLVSFFVVAGYWGRHRRLMKSVETIHPVLIRDTFVLLLLVAAMPFPASLIGKYASLPFTFVVYGSMNALASITLMVLSRDVRRERGSAATADDTHDVVSWANLVVFLLCIPAGYAVGHLGGWVLALLALPRLVGRISKVVGRRRSAVPAPAG